MKKKRYKNTRGFVFKDGVLKTKSRRLKRILENSPFNEIKLFDGDVCKTEIFIPKQASNVE